MFVIFNVCGKNKHSLTFQTIFHCDQDANNVAKTKNIYPTAFQKTLQMKVYKTIIVSPLNGYNIQSYL